MFALLSNLCLASPLLMKCRAKGFKSGWLQRPINFSSVKWREEYNLQFTGFPSLDLPPGMSVTGKVYPILQFKLRRDQSVDFGPVLQPYFLSFLLLFLAEEPVWSLNPVHHFAFSGTTRGPCYHNRDSGIECTLSKLCDVADTLEGRDAIQRDLDNPERWTCANLMKFNKVKDKILHVGQGNTNPESQLCPGLHQKKPDQQVEEGDAPPLVSSYETPLGILQHKKDMETDFFTSNVALYCYDLPLKLLMDEISQPMGKRDKNKSTDRDDIHLRVLKKLGNGTPETLLHASKFSVRVEYLITSQARRHTENFRDLIPFVILSSVTVSHGYKVNNDIIQAV
ncbi:hypothetical protein WISP_84873 [Willisornis vidua]|uniref:Uncharacterized protein n=1 Tax=Willisornis vidua TaxID=1566151 RepID=A0ABQ9D972_9PASS|nr:hypothetical protein WISP_84873 [Willisornis vidua]